MKASLEDVLKEKEQELKLYERFLHLKTFCKKKVFSGVNLPLQHHVEILKEFLEKIIPDPKDRTEEMFSGEIFALLGTLYLHDVGFIKGFPWSVNREILDFIDGKGKEIFLNYEIGRKLNIPESAIEIINYLSYSHIVSKIPAEWEISDNGARAIIRNPITLESIFNFTHLLVDIFYSDIRLLSLRRYEVPRMILRSDEAIIDIDNKEGIINIQYKAISPYEIHVLKKAKGYVENMFAHLKNNANGRLGLQYKEIIWDITSDFSYDAPGELVISQDNEIGAPPSGRWDESAMILDRLFDYGYAMVIGDACSGKTTVLKSFVAPQLLHVSPNVFYCEIWSHATSEIGDVISQKLKHERYGKLDIVSLCKKLLEEAPCFIILDAAERFALLSVAEREKLERFIDFCMGEKNIYLLVCGNKESFLDWHQLFHGINSSAFYEIKAMEGKRSEINEHLKKTLEDLLPQLNDTSEFRLMMAALIDTHEKMLTRYTLEEIMRATSLPGETIISYITAMKEKKILRETEFQGRTYYSLANRHLEEPLYALLHLDVFEEKKKIQNMLNHFIGTESFLDDESLMLVDALKEQMVFTKEEIGLILGSLLAHQKDGTYFFTKAKKDGQGISIQPILRLLHTDDAVARTKAVQLLADIGDKEMVNPLLRHLKKEDIPEVKDLIVKAVGLTGKKKAIIAIINILREIGDSALRLSAIEYFYSISDGDGRRMLLAIKETEEDLSIVYKIDQLLSNPEESG
ncbi:MAG: hypothetical protein C0399_05865 [Syntrophus sp. (in: bacteria)]|nr:hypothetical protein [Syntrophus sp. (in: bacteria)]